MKKDNIIIGVLTILFVGLIIAILFVRLSLYSGTIDPNTNTAELSNLKSDKVICVESDDGLNYEVVGNISSNNFVSKDYCINNLELNEYYCGENKEVLSKVFSCKFRCEEGKCVNSTP